MTTRRKVTFTRAQQPSRDHTERDLALLQLLVDGWTDKEIAASTRCSPGSIRVYLHYLYQKLGVSTRTQAAVKALREGLVK